MNRLASFLLLTFSVPLSPWAGSIAPTDATTGASIFVDSGRTTDSSANLFWHENKVNGKLRLYWDTLPILAFPVHAIDSLEWLFLPGQVKTVRPANAAFPGPGQSRLKPGRTYWYFLQGFYPYPDHTTTELPPWPSMAVESIYRNRGSFTTSAPTSVLPRPLVPHSAIEALHDVRGRPLSASTTEIGFTNKGPALQPGVHPALPW